MSSRMFVERVHQDVRHALRSARKTPGFAAIIVLTLAAGIGVNTAMFTVINSVLLRKAPYADPERLVTLRQRFPKVGEVALGASPAEYLDYRDRTVAFSSIAGYEHVVFDLTGGHEPARIQAIRATHTLFSTLGVGPHAGRTFSASEDRPDGANVAIVSYEFWQRHLGGSAGAIGTRITLDEQPHTVVGIMPRGFEFPFSAAAVGEPPAVWVPMAFRATELQNRVAEFPVHLVARLRPGVSLAHAQQDVDSVAAGFQREHPDIYRGNLRLEANLEPLDAHNVARARPVLLTLAGAVVFVLLIACANVMNLLIARAAVRQREIAVRHALGASRSRLFSQWLTEALLLTAGGAVLGCMLAQLVVTLVRTFSPRFVAGLADLQIDFRVLGLTVGLTVATGLLCGIAPALSWTGGDVSAGLKQGGRQGALQERRRVRSVLVVFEAASAALLVIGAGLLLHSLIEALRVPIGFSPDGVVIARTTFNRQRYPAHERRREAERHMTERLRSLPGVTAVGLSTHIPLADSRQIGFLLEGEDIRAVRWADNALVSGDYFAALGISLLRGRTFDHQDTPDAPIAAIVNESMARRFWPAGDAIGRRLLWGGRRLTVVGVVGDVHIAAVDSPVNPTIYTSIYQVASGATTNAIFVVRTATADPTALAASIRAALWSIDPGVPVFDIRAMGDVVARSLAPRRFAVLMLSSFAALALALALVGLYGVLAHSVTQRTSEFGVRFALGATPTQVLRQVLGEGVRLTLSGVCVGAALGAAAARAMSHLLFGIRALDPATFGAAAAVMLAVALLASAVPARRAARIDPLVALRSE